METPEEKYSISCELYMGMELSQSTWKLGFSNGNRQVAWVRTIHAHDLDALQAELEQAKAKYKQSAEVPVRSCYEAGLDGFWLHRYLEGQGIENIVVDPASVEVNRRAKQRKTDRLDAEKLVRHLIRYYAGEAEVWKVVQVPSAEAEQQRHLHRQLWNLKNDWKRYRNRIYGVLKTQGVEVQIGKHFLEEIEAVRIWNGEALPAELQRRVRINYSLLEAVGAEIKALEQERQQLLKSGETRAIQRVRQLRQLRGVGDNGAWVLVMEFFGWRKFRNRREVAGLAGLAPTPYASGNIFHEQGISKAGNRWVRAMMVELAWAWLRYQPDSGLSQWWHTEYDHTSPAERKKGIVALARKLLVAFWVYLDKGLVADGAQLKTV